MDTTNVAQSLRGFRLTYAALASDINSRTSKFLEGQFVEVAVDETRNSAYTLYQIQANSAQFVAILETAVGTTNAALVALSGITPAANKLPYFTSATAAALADLSAFGRSLIDDAAASNARTTLGLGTAAVANTGDFDTAGAAAAAQAASQPLDSDLTAIAALTTTSYGRSLLTLANQAALRTETAPVNLGSLAGAFSTTGAFTLNLNTTANTNITLPTTGTLAILGANTFVGVQKFPDGTSSAPSIASSTTPATGIAFNQGGQHGIQIVDNGTIGWLVDTARIRGRSNTSINWSAGTDPTATGPDVGIGRAAAQVISINAGDDNTTGGTFRAVATIPAQITANKDNYNPGGSSYLQRWSSDASRNVTGLTFTAAQVDGQVHQIWNVGAQNIVLTNSATSTAANQWLTSTGADLTLAANKCAFAIYDGTTAKWRVWLGN